MNNRDVAETSLEIRKHFDRHATNYSTNFSCRKKLGKQVEFATRLEIVNTLAVGMSGNFLDCACGSGEITSSVLQVGEFSRVIVGDISEKMLSLANARIAEMMPGKKVEYILSNIFDYEPADSVEFDLILCIGLVAHTGNIVELLSRLHRMLSPSGKIIFQSSLSGHLGIKLTRFATEGWYEKKHGYKIHYYSLSELLESISRSGLQVLETRRYCFGIPFGDRIFPKLNYWLERHMKKSSAMIGSEAIFLLGRDSNT